jgi:hypothetical protein
MNDSFGFGCSNRGPDVCRHLCSDLLPEVEQSVFDIGMCGHYLEIAICRGDIWRNLNYALSENKL